MNILGQQWASPSPDSLWERRKHPDAAPDLGDLADIPIAPGRRVIGRGVGGQVGHPGQLGSMPFHHYAYGQSRPSLRPGLAR